jgi:hypothetical protein
MTRFIAVLALLGAAAVRADVPLKWQFAGENQGIQFYFRISNECKESGARVEMKLENTLDRAVTVNFRLVDPDWEQKFARELGPNMKDAAIKFTPESGTSCHPYVDEVYVQSRETQVSKAGEPLED